MSKRRSGLKNHQRAYNYYFVTSTTPQECSPITININDIATLNNSNQYDLNGDTTIRTCEILVIEDGIRLNIRSHTLTNNGTINNNYLIYNDTGGSIDNVAGGIINNKYRIYYGTINNTSGGIINNTDGGSLLGNDGGIINNTGGIINNNSGGIIDNTEGGLINNTGGTIYLGDDDVCGLGIITGSVPLGNPVSLMCPP